jgi:fatty-acyl-CoA synthase
MNVAAEIEQYVTDSGATTAIVARELADRYRPLVGSGLQHLVIADDGLAEQCEPGPLLSRADDLCAILYTSGTTAGRRAACTRIAR